MQREHSLGCGARGFLVSKLQEKLRLYNDEIFGKRTQSALVTLQQQAGRPATGRAGVEDFMALGMACPTDFELSMNLVSQFEGTGFGDCNNRDIDGAGLTMGIAGFTTGHGEVQQLLRRYIQLAPEAIRQHLPATTVDQLHYLANLTACDVKAWKQLFFSNTDKVASMWMRAFAAWGRDAIMQQLQLEYAYRRFWIPAVRVAETHQFYSLQAKCLFLDIAVQNGGWRQRHLQTASRSASWENGSVAERMIIAADAVASTSLPRWRSDVLSRKRSIACGKGVIHGRLFNLSDYGLCMP